MTRRGFLGALMSGALITIVSRLPWRPYGAVFKVTYVDPDGSGQDYAGLLGRYVYNAARCCQNCTIILAAFAPGGDVDNGPGFCHGALTPVNESARRMMVAVKARDALMRRGAAEFALAS